MACMCGSTDCPSCGPAQGANPAFEMVCEWMVDVVLVDLPKFLDREWLAEDLTDRLGRHLPLDVVQGIEAEARKWARKRRYGHRET